MRHPCPACKYPNPTGTERCQGCGAYLAGLRTEQVPSTRKADVATPVAPNPTRLVPQKARTVRPKSSNPKPLREPESLPQLSLSNSPSLGQWIALPEKAGDGTVRFRPQNSKSLFALV